jgi:hypothetical protein
MTDEEIVMAMLALCDEYGLHPSPEDRASLQIDITALWLQAGYPKSAKWNELISIAEDRYRSENGLPA